MGFQQCLGSISIDAYPDPDPGFTQKRNGSGSLSVFWLIFCFLDPDPYSGGQIVVDQTHLDPDPKHWFSILVLNTEYYWERFSALSTAGKLDKTVQKSHFSGASFFYFDIFVNILGENCYLSLDNFKDNLTFLGDSVAIPEPFFTSVNFSHKQKTYNFGIIRSEK